MFPEGRIVDFLIVGAVALIVVGPKDLPILMRKVGQFLARMRAMAAEFRASFDELARQSELDELRREVEALRHGRGVDPIGDPRAGAVLAEIDAGLSAGAAQLHPPTLAETPLAPAAPAAAPGEPVDEAALSAPPAKTCS
jgi:sec-independent protein translocase protein TatB